MGSKRMNQSLSQTLATEKKSAPSSQKAIIRKLLKNKITFVGLIIVLFYTLVVILAPVLPLYDPLEMHGKNAFDPPSREFLLGTDSSGRDILSRLIFGARSSFTVAILSVALSGIVGTSIGLISGYYGGWLDIVTMRVMDIVFAFPAVLLGLVIIASLGSGTNKVILALAIVYTPTFARVVRGPTLSVKEKLYVEAAHTIGCKNSQIIRKHILPNVLAPVIVQISLALSWALLTEAVFSFLGLGTQPPNPSWGLMLDEGRRYMEFAPWMAIFAGIAIMMIVLGFNLFGDGLRDILDPYIRNR